MKKTLNISIAKKLFNLEDDAYQKLDQYLGSIKNHFNDSADKSEIIADIEERIAEHFQESKTGIITIDDVESLIKTMGTVDQFERSEEKNTNAKSQTKPKQLYRDTDNAIVAGVASGLAHYFGIDPIIVRIIFIASIFIGGTGILIYIILWLVVPEAKTASQKLSMYGDPITLETISEGARDRLNEIKIRDKSGLRRLVTFPFRIIGNVIRFLANFIPIIVRIFFGSLLVIVSVAVLVFAMIASGFMVSGDVMIFDGVLLQDFIPGLIRYLIILGSALAIIIPALFAFLGGISLFKKKSLITSYTGFGLLGLWLITLLISGYGVAKVASRYETLVNVSPAYEESTSTIAIESAFNKVQIQNGLNIKIVEGGTSTPSMLVKGRVREINSVQGTVANDTLNIERQRTKTDQFCLFCFHDDNSLEITLTVTNALEALSVLHGSSATADLASSPILDLNIENSSNAEFSVKAKNITAKVIHGSRLTINGESTSADISLENGSVLDGDKFKVIDAKITAMQGSRANIEATKTLDATAKNGSVIDYTGDPIVTKTETQESSIRPEN